MKHRGDGETWPQRTMAVFTVLIFIATLAYCIVSYWQWRELQLSNERSQRAWILVTAKIIKSERIDDATKKLGIAPWGLRFTLRNSGPSPARLRSYSVGWAQSQQPMRSDLCPVSNLQAGELTQIVPPSNREGFLVIDGPLIADALHKALVTERGKGFTLHGFIYYTDVFDKPRSTQFCAFLLPHIDASNAIIPDSEKAKGNFGECFLCNSLQ